MACIAVIDTETNWVDQVMSIGTVIAERDSFRMVDARYQVLTPEYEIGGMYEATLFADPKLRPEMCSRPEAINSLKSWFASYDVREIFAYNASFDRNHLPELREYTWYDIMRLAAYRQYNHKIPKGADCYSTGRLKRNYGVEPMYRLLCGESCYCETHNAMHDAFDELQILKALGYPVNAYIPL